MIQPAPRTIPLDRFRALVGELAIDQQAWGDAFWLRFAAQIAVLSPDEPAVTAARIRDAAATLREHSQWYDALSSPARFVIAALLVQSGIRPRTFLHQHQAIAGLFQEAGIRASGIFQTIAILVMRLSNQGRRHVTERQVVRVKAIYDQLESYHWWLTGPDDLPACAALAHCTGRPGDLAAQVEDCYQRLIEAGLDGGDPLQTTACILPLAGREPSAAVGRFLANKRASEADGSVLVREEYESMALLALVDHDPTRIIERLRAVEAELRLTQPSLLHGVCISIAADLVALDFIGLDADLQPIRDDAGLKQVRDGQHLLRVAAAVLISQAGIGREGLENAMAIPAWP